MALLCQVLSIIPGITGHLSALLFYVILLSQVSPHILLSLHFPLGLSPILSSVGYRVYSPQLESIVCLSWFEKKSYWYDTGVFSTEDEGMRPLGADQGHSKESVKDLLLLVFEPCSHPWYGWGWVNCIQRGRECDAHSDYSIYTQQSPVCCSTQLVKRIVEGDFIEVAEMLSDNMVLKCRWLY